MISGTIDKYIFYDIQKKNQNSVAKYRFYSDLHVSIMCFKTILELPKTSSFEIGCSELRFKFTYGIILS